MGSGRRSPPVLAVIFAAAFVGAGFYVLGFYLFLGGSRWFWLWLLIFLGGLGALYAAARDEGAATLRPSHIVLGILSLIVSVLLASYLGLGAEPPWASPPITSG